MWYLIAVIHGDLNLYNKKFTQAGDIPFVDYGMNGSSDYGDMLSITDGNGSVDIRNLGSKFFVESFVELVNEPQT